jgi:DNA invertase Pin-like site-specific DNA recombinase
MNTQTHKGQNLAYIRVSALDQNTQRQHEILKNYQIDHFFEEKISGVIKDRPELDKLKTFCRAGDTIYVTSLDRLGRSNLQLHELVEFFKDKKVTVHFISENIIIDHSNNSVSELIFSIFSSFAQFNRTRIKESQAEGILVAKQNGVKFGRKALLKPDKAKELYQEWLEKGRTKTKDLAEKHGMKVHTYYKYIRQFKDN